MLAAYEFALTSAAFQITTRDHQQLLQLEVGD
jgi:hypothetical protein